jgi:hypothetical protein
MEDTMDKRRPPARIIPLPDRTPPPRPALLRRLGDALSELEICLLALGIAADLKLKRKEK